MNNNYSYLFFDASFLNHLYRIDHSCELVEYFDSYSNANTKCVVDQSQYNVCPCNDFNYNFVFLHELISDEELIDRSMNSTNLIQDLSKISRDPTDVKAFLWALGSNDILIMTCDKNFLLLCNLHNIYHTCFKNAIKILDVWMGGELIGDPSINIDSMTSGDDPFFNFDRNTRCSTHCGPSSLCIIHKAKNN